MGQSLGAYEHAYTPDKARADIDAQIAKLDARIATQRAQLAVASGEMTCALHQAQTADAALVEQIAADARATLEAYKTLSASLASATQMRDALLAQRNALGADADVVDSLAIIERTTPLVQRQTASLVEARRILAAAGESSARPSPQATTTIAEIERLLASAPKSKD